MAEGGEDIEMQDLSVREDVDDEETSLLGNRNLHRELLETKVDDYYNAVGMEPDVKDYNAFEFGKDNKSLFVKTKNGNKVQLTHKNDSSRFRSLETIKQEIGGAQGIREHLSLSNYKPKVNPKVAAQLEETRRKLPVNVESIPMHDLSITAANISSSIETIVEENTMQSTTFPMRELLGLDKSLQTIRGELTNNLAKLGELDKHIEREKEKLVEADDANLGTEVKQRIESRLKDLNQERSARLEVLSNNKEQLRSQVSRIRETINRILHEDTTLAERIKTLFREQGITIASILTAFGFVISTVVLAITGTGSSPPPPPKDPKDLKNWIKKQLSHLSELLKKLGIKALDSLPAIIGSIVSWLFSTAGKVVGYMADHLWTLLVLVAGLLISKIKKI
jgi:hypothetical protein